MKLINIVSTLFRGWTLGVLQPSGDSNGHCLRLPLEALSIDDDHKINPHRIAVHLHLYYLDLLDELISYLGNIPFPFDLFITTVNPIEGIKARIKRDFDVVTVLQVENRGRDLGGFLSVISRFELDRYDIVLKIHSKKSLNMGSYIEAVQGLFGQDVVDGDVWRRQLLDPILGDRERVARIIAAFQKNHHLGMVGASKFLCSVPDTNTSLYKDLCRKLQVKEEILFFAGTMFWIRGSLLKKLRVSGFNPNDFKLDSKAVEGELEHCFERIFGALVASHGSIIAGA